MLDDIESYAVSHYFIESVQYTYILGYESGVVLIICAHTVLNFNTTKENIIKVKKVALVDRQNLTLQTMKCDFNRWQLKFLNETNLLLVCGLTYIKNILVKIILKSKQ